MKPIAKELRLTYSSILFFSKSQKIVLSFRANMIYNDALTPSDPDKLEPDGKGTI